jgi:hypothetical protein
LTPPHRAQHERFLKCLQNDPDCSTRRDTLVDGLVTSLWRFVRVPVPTACLFAVGLCEAAGVLETESESPMELSACPGEGERP